jgi:hypothetical protein
MWDPITYASHERGYIFLGFGHYYVMRDGENESSWQVASNWKALEKEAQQAVLSSPWTEDDNPYSPLTWSLLEKAEFPPREQDKAQETYLAGDGQGRFFVRHLEYGKPVDQWREVETYIAHDIEESRYIVENKDGIALNWEALEPEARAAVVQMGEEFQDRYIVECPPELAQKAIFLPNEELDLEPFPWEEAQTPSLRSDVTHDFDFGR